MRNEYIKSPFKEEYHSLEDFVDHLNDLLMLPITIEDSNHRLLAYSAHDLQTDAARIGTIISRRVPEDVVNNLWQRGVIPSLLQTDEPIRVNEMNDIGLGNRVAISIRKKEEVLGYIWVIEAGRSLSENELNLLMSATNIAKHLLFHLEVRKHKKEEDHQALFLELLSGMVTSKQELDRRLKQVNIVRPKIFTILAFQFSNEINQKGKSQISYILKNIQSVKTVFYYADKTQLYMLSTFGVSNKEHHHDHLFQSFIEEFIAQMEDRFQTKVLYGGYGGIYEHLEQVEKSYKEALTTLSMKAKFPNETKTYYGYHTLGIFQLLEALNEYKQEHKIENMSIKQIREYDQKHNSFLLETLEMYLNKDSNLNETAIALHIHVNTLNYRLKRISDIGNINLKDPNQKINLYIHLKMEKM